MEVSRIKASIALFVFAILALPVAGAACSMVTIGDGQLRDVDEREYVFIGKVAGYTDEVPGKRKEFPGFGIKVATVGLVNAPVVPAAGFEVFPLALWPDCSSVGVPLYQLTERYPVGMEVRVIARPALVYFAGVPPGVVRLEIETWAGGVIERNGDERARFMSTADGYYDYGARGDKASTPDERNAVRRTIAFEIRKDILRLKATRNAADTTWLASRLRRAPRGYGFDIEAILAKYGK